MLKELNKTKFNLEINRENRKNDILFLKPLKFYFIKNFEFFWVKNTKLNFQQTLKYCATAWCIYDRALNPVK